MPRKRAAGFDNQRDLIIEQAATLFARNGFPGTSMNEVAEACGLSKASLYHYMSDKYQLLMFICEGHIERLCALVAALGRGGGSVVGVTGGAGLGQGRVVAEAMREAPSRGAWRVCRALA